MIFSARKLGRVLLLLECNGLISAVPTELIVPRKEQAPRIKPVHRPLRVSPVVEYKALPLPDI
jgi:hypothetical protein